ncbi:cation:proton antiporter domain-containing protein [Undibacterium fentianense]|uniref:Cation:proton antiporter n=1 Tax=Undibacterium fentianense TaxID=2828728 RepID=A0A941E3V4_9BURK|nr:cation:proton antiporter [Undibacterium fentianense]MBR7801021.1 cation:proton antiporter [Undibacterium fentianense]
MESQETLPFLRETILFLTLAGILIPLLQRYRINQVLGFLCVGLLFGPHGLAQFDEHIPWLRHIAFHGDEEMHSLAELGVMFLMFLIGLELSVERLWNLRRWVFLGGGAQLLLSAVCIAIGAYVFGNSTKVSILLGLVLSLSSTAMVMQFLTQQRQLPSPLGQASFSILMMQDFAVVPLLILVDLLASNGDMNMSVVVALTLLKSAGAVLAIFFVGRRVLGPVFCYFAKHRQPEVFMALTLLVTLGISALTAAAGLSLALGAFLAGLLLAETEYRHEVEVTIDPFKGLLMGLFFMSVGMGIDLSALMRNFVWITFAVLGLFFIKAGVVTLIMRKGGLNWGKALEGGTLLGQGGEFAFVIIGVATTNQIFSKDLSQFMLLVVSLSLLLTPAFAKFGQLVGERIDKYLQKNSPPIIESVPTELSAHIVIAGFGRVGQLLAQVFEQQGVAYIAIEHDAHAVAQLRKKGKHVFYGNAARPDLLRKMHMQHATAFVVTMDQPNAAMHAVKAARSEYPNLLIYARSRDEIHARELHEAGASAVVPETLEAGLQLSFFALSALHVPDQQITAILDQEREARVAGQ